jgi:hypothetical protein
MMEAPTKDAESPVKSTVGVESRSWLSFNAKGDTADVVFIPTQTLDGLPDTVKKALEIAAGNAGGLDVIGVNWRVCCLTKDGKVIVNKSSKVFSGERSGGIGTCGEVDMWSTVAGVNKKSERNPNASACFDLQSAIYVIDAGMCPCSRCSNGLLTLASLLQSTIIVRGLTDYDVLAITRTDLAQVPVHVMVFEPGATAYKVYSSAERTGVREEKKEQASLLYKCEKQHEYLILCTDTAPLLKQPMAAYKCKRCFGKKKLEYTTDKPGLKKPEQVEVKDLEAWVEKVQHKK